MEDVELIGNDNYLLKLQKRLCHCIDMYAEDSSELIK